MDVPTVLPKELRLDAPPSMPQARSYLFRQQSTLATYTPGSTLQINIPRLQRSYLKKDSYLQFDLTTAYNATYTVNNVNNIKLIADPVITFDTAGAYSLIDKLEVFDYLGSTVLESISGVNALMAGIMDIGTKEGTIAKQNPHAGVGPDAAINFASTEVPVSGLYVGNGFIESSNTGNKLTEYSNVVTRPTEGNLNGAVRIGTCDRFSIHLPSFLGFLSEKLVPLHNGFTIVITLAPAYEALCVGIEPDVQLVSTDVPEVVDNVGVFNSMFPYWDTRVTSACVEQLDWSISNVTLNCDILELGPQAESMLLSSTQGMPLTVHSKQFRNYTGAVTQAQSEFILNLNINVASLTNIVWGMRPTFYRTDGDGLHWLSLGERTRNFLSRWEFQYGSSVLPQSNGLNAMPTFFPSLSTLGLSNTAYAFSTAAKQYGGSAFRSTESYEALLNSRNVDSDVTQGRITLYNYNKDILRGMNGSTIGLPDLTLVWPGPRTNVTTGRFLGGLGLELMNDKSGSLISGLNTNGMNTAIRGSFHPSYTYLVQPCSLDVWTEFDAFINISPGIATTVSF